MRTKLALFFGPLAGMALMVATDPLLAAASAQQNLADSKLTRDGIDLFYTIVGTSGDYVLVLSGGPRSEEHTSELQSLRHLVCRLLLEKKKRYRTRSTRIARGGT